MAYPAKPDSRPNRRQVLAAALAVAPVFSVAAIAQSQPKIVIIGGGFGGASMARALRRGDPSLDVSLIEINPSFIACPFSNEVIAGLRDMSRQRFGYEAIARDGVRIVHAGASGVDMAARKVTLADGSSLSYDRLILSPGVDLRFDALEGYTATAVDAMPHAWKAGEQTLLLRRQLEEMRDGGLVVMSIPANPYRCPPGPYERASLIAHYLKTHKPRSKLILLDAKDVFSKQKLFTAAWAALYPGLLEWISLSNGGKVTAVKPAEKAFVTDFETYRADVANVIPPQRAARIAELAGVADKTGWCPVDPVTFESKLQPGIHVLGDAALMGAMPKSAFAANAQAKVCAAAIISLMSGEAPAEPRLINTCYSLVEPGYGISIAGVYRPSNGQLTEIEGAGGASPQDAPASFRALEAEYGESWFRTITAEVFA
jgi:sulfide dehydrogenase [flavocytochrome c] flavoprotein subunit